MAEEKAPPSDKRVRARALLMKAKIYRLVAIIFAFAGIMIFFVSYIRNVNEGVLEMFRHPSLIGVVLIPFLPAFMLVRIADKAERELAELVATKPADAAAAPTEAKK